MGILREAPKESEESKWMRRKKTHGNTEGQIKVKEVVMF